MLLSWLLNWNFTIPSSTSFWKGLLCYQTNLLNRVTFYRIYKHKHRDIPDSNRQIGCSFDNVDLCVREDDLDVSIVSRSSRLFPQLFLMRLLFFKVTFGLSGPFGLRSAALVFWLSRLVGRSVIPSVVFVKSIFSQLYCMYMHVCFIKRQVSDVRFMNIY